MSYSSIEKLYGFSVHLLRLVICKSVALFCRESVNIHVHQFCGLCEKNFFFCKQQSVENMTARLSNAKRNFERIFFIYKHAKIQKLHLVSVFITLYFCS